MTRRPPYQNLPSTDRFPELLKMEELRGYNFVTRVTEY